MRKVLAVLAVLTVWAGHNAYADPPPVYYLALGDSLSRGIQPNPTTGVLFETTQGYVDDLYAHLRLRRPGLRLAKLGCSGETTSTMIIGGVCQYPLVSQLEQAAQFLQTNTVALVTLSIGGDNILHCLSVQGIDQTCVTNGIGMAAANLPYILARLRAAAGPNVPIVAMNYYDPFLGLWIYGPVGKALADQSLEITKFFNQLLGGIYAQAQVPVADVARAFRITNTTPVSAFHVPFNVLLTLAWTWMGLPPPRGPDIHPNAIGYAVIAGAFVRVIGR
jgi:lysophospholipase L1-like esterase